MAIVDCFPTENRPDILIVSHKVRGPFPDGTPHSWFFCHCLCYSRASERWVLLDSLVYTGAVGALQWTELQWRTIGMHLTLAMVDFEYNTTDSGVVAGPHYTPVKYHDCVETMRTRNIQPLAD